MSEEENPTLLSLKTQQLYEQIQELLKKPDKIPIYNGKGTPPVLIYDKDGVQLYQNQNTKVIYKGVDNAR